MDFYLDRSEFQWHLLPAVPQRSGVLRFQVRKQRYQSSDFQWYAGMWLPGCYFRFRFSHRRAVGHIDRFFDLKEGLVTAHEHMRENRNEEIHELQLRHTGRIIEPLDPSRVRPRFSRRLLAISIVLLACSISLLLVDDSQAIKAQQAVAAERRGRPQLLIPRPPMFIPPSGMVGF